jgi:hypothetical protein
MKRSKRLGDGVYSYEGAIRPKTGGSYSYGVRVRPAHPDLADEHEVGLVRWA